MRARVNIGSGGFWDSFHVLGIKVADIFVLG